MLKDLCNKDLKNAIWNCKHGRKPEGGYPLEYYENELFARTGSKKGFFEGEDNLFDESTDDDLMKHNLKNTI